jgi:FAD/FMN-containing dehydrogenase
MLLCLSDGMTMTEQLDATTIQSLRDRLQGQILIPDDPGYDGARAVWNGRFDPRPLAVVRCSGPTDVAASVVWARARGLPLSVKGGGHSYAGHSVGDGALAIDLSSMNGVRVDRHSRTAVVGPGARWADLDREAQAHSLATTGGTVSTVGVAGYILGGGTGYLARKYGLGLDNLIGAEVVTADGRVVAARKGENADLFWALRGGSGNFGIVTSFEFRLHPVGPQVATAQAFHPIEDARRVLRFYRELTRGAPDELTVYAFALRVPPIDPFPETRRGQVALALIACHCGDVEEGVAALQPVVDHGDPMVAAVQTVQYAALQQSFDAGMAPGQRWYSRAHYLADLSDAAIDTMARFAEVLPGPFTMAYFEHLGGAVGRVDPTATAFPHRSAPYSVHIFPGWTDPADDEAHMAWAREFHEAMAPHATGGVYVNLLGRDEQERVPAAYASNYDRLREIKAAWDPDNVFRANHNIPPAS